VVAVELMWSRWLQWSRIKCELLGRQSLGLRFGDLDRPSTATSSTADLEIFLMGVGYLVLMDANLL
jgi:hypothetical protein